MSDAAIVLKQARYSVLGTVRNPRVLVFSVLFPVILLVLFSSIFTGGSDTTKFSGGTISAHAYFTAGILAYAIMMAAFTSMVIGITAKRESGQLKRMRGTPMPAWTFITAELLRCVAQVTVVTVALLAIGNLAFNVAIPGEGLVGLVGYVALGTGTLAVLGIALTAATPNEDSAAAIAPFAAVMLSFFSGVFVPVEQLPNWLEDLGRVFPLFHLADGLQRTLVTGGGTGLAVGNLAVMGAWLVAGLVVAVRFFRWEPQTSPG